MRRLKKFLLYSNPLILNRKIDESDCNSCLIMCNASIFIQDASFSSFSCMYYFVNQSPYCFQSLIKASLDFCMLYCKSHIMSHDMTSIENVNGISSLAKITRVYFVDSCGDKTTTDQGNIVLGNVCHPNSFNFHYLLSQAVVEIYTYIFQFSKTALEFGDFYNVPIIVFVIIILIKTSQVREQILTK